MKKKSVKLLFPLSLFFILILFALFVIKKKTEKEIFQSLEEFDIVQ